MIGVFDSGVGGLNSYRELRCLMPTEDIIYLADGKNAPYGTKSERELLRLVKNDIKLLSDMGADKILIACCTASTVYGKLTEEEQKISIPIIIPAAKSAVKYGERITVIATERTVASHSFKREISDISPTMRVTEIPTQNLVDAAERLVRYGYIDEESQSAIDSAAEKIRATNADALILGCTHFSYFESALRNRLPKVKIINPAKIGAGELARIYKNENSHRPKESGREVFIDTE